MRFISTRSMISSMPRVPYPVSAHSASGTGIGQLAFITHNASPRIVRGPNWDYFSVSDNIPQLDNALGYSDFTINMQNEGSGPFKYRDLSATLTAAADTFATIEILNKASIPRVLGPGQTVSFVVRVYNTVVGLYRFNIGFFGVENSNYITGTPGVYDIPTLSNVRFTAGSTIDVTPTPTPDWGNVAYNDGFTLSTYSARIVEGINQPITLQLNYTSNAQMQMYYKVQATAFSPTDAAIFSFDPATEGYTAINPSGTFVINNNDWVSWCILPGPNYKGGSNQLTMTVVNVTDSNTTIDTFLGIVQP